MASLLQAKASLAFLAASLLVYYFCYKQDGHPGLQAAFNIPTLIQHGWYDWPKVRDEGQWWRFFSTLYVSTFAIDAFFYAYLFMGLAPQAEKALGSLRFAALYLLAGAGALAIGEVFDPATRRAGTILAVYALLGAIPGLVLGSTLSLLKTLAHGSVRSAGFYVVMILLISSIQGQTAAGGNRDGITLLTAMCLGFVLGAALMLTRVRPKVGWPIALALLATTAGMIGLAAKGYAVRDGKLTSRGAPLKPGDPEPKPEPPKDPLGTPDKATSDADRERAKVTPFLKRFGPLPTGFVSMDANAEFALADEKDREEAARLLEGLNKLAKGTNLILDQLDPERIRLMILLAKFQEAARLAEDYHAMHSTPEARALSGVALLALGGPDNLDRARDRLEGAVLSQDGFGQQWPEAVYLVGCIFAKQKNPEEAKTWFEKFLTLVGRDPAAQSGPWRRPLVEHALTEPWKQQ